MENKCARCKRFKAILSATNGVVRLAQEMFGEQWFAFDEPGTRKYRMDMALGRALSKLHQIKKLRR